MNLELPQQPGEQRNFEEVRFVVAIRPESVDQFAKAVRRLVLTFR